MKRFFIQSANHYLYCICLTNNNIKIKTCTHYNSHIVTSLQTYSSKISLCLILHPFFEEKKDTRKLLIDLGKFLTQTIDIIALLDFRGCGESTGEMSEFTLSDWSKDIVRFLDLFKDKITLYMIGIRFGCIPLSMAIPEISTDNIEIKKIIFCDPVFSGTQYFEELLYQHKIRAMLTFQDKTKKTDFSLTRKKIETIFRDNQKNNVIDLDGYPISSTLYTAIHQISPYKISELLKNKKAEEIRILYTDNSHKYNMEIEQFKKYIRKVYNVTPQYLKLPPYWRNIEFNKKDFQILSNSIKLLLV